MSSKDRRSGVAFTTWEEQLTELHRRVGDRKVLLLFISDETEPRIELHDRLPALRASDVEGGLLVGFYDDDVDLWALRRFLRLPAEVRRAWMPAASSIVQLWCGTLMDSVALVRVDSKLLAGLDGPETDRKERIIEDPT